MHPQSPLLTIGGTVLKESDYILGVTFDSKLTFEMYLRLVSRAASQRLGILRKSWRVFHDRSLLERCFRGFVLPVLQCGARLPMHTLNNWTVQSVVPGFLLVVCLSVTLLIVDLLQFCACCLRSGVTKCTRLMMRYLDRMCQCGLHRVPWSHIRILTYAPPRCRTSQYRRTSVHLSVSLFNDLAGVGLAERSCRIRWCGTGGFQDQGQCFFIGLSCSIPTIVFYYFSFSFLPV